MAQKDNSKKEEGAPRGHTGGKRDAEKVGRENARDNISQDKKESVSGANNVILMGAPARTALQSGTKTDEIKIPQTGKEASANGENGGHTDTNPPIPKTRTNLGRSYFGFFILFVALLLIGHGSGWFGPVSVHYTALWPLLVITAGLSLFSVKYKTRGSRAIVTLLILIVFIISAALLLRNDAIFTVNAAGEASEVIHNTEPFNHLVFRGNGSVTLEQSDKTSIVVSSDKNIMDEIAVESDGGTLTISYKHPLWDLLLFDDAHMDVTISTPVIKNIQLSGNGSIEGSDITSSDLTVLLDGSGTITLDNVTADTLTTRLAGTGDIAIAGETMRELVYLTGSGTYHGESLMSDEAGIRVSGIGDAYVHAEKELNASIAGRGNIFYTGTPVITDDSVTGSGSIEPANTGEIK